MLSFMKLLGGEDDDDEGPDDPRAPRVGRHDPHAPRHGRDDPFTRRQPQDSPWTQRDARGVPLYRGHYPEPRPSRPRRSMTDPETWNAFWQEQMSSGMAALTDLFCSDGPLVDTMRANGLRSILCVGSGISQEPKALALAGFDVTVLDISPLALKLAEELDPPEELLRGLIGGRKPGRRRRVRFVAGDLADMSVCPGPFDVVLERRTLQLYSDEEQPAAMRALAARLATPGVFYSHSHHNRGYAPQSWPSDWFHAERWPIGRSDTPLTTRVAWLSTSSG